MPRSSPPAGPCGHHQWVTTSRLSGRPGLAAGGRPMTAPDRSPLLRGSARTPHPRRDGPEPARRRRALAPPGPRERLTLTPAVAPIQPRPLPDRRLPDSSAAPRGGRPAGRYRSARSAEQPRMIHVRPVRAAAPGICGPSLLRASISMDPEAETLRAAWAGLTRWWLRRWRQRARSSAPLRVAPPAGFEPATVGLEVRCAIHCATGARRARVHGRRRQGTRSVHARSRVQEVGVRPRRPMILICC